MRVVSVAVLLLVMGSTVHGGEVDISGSLELQARFFPNDPAWVGQNDRALHGSTALSADIGWYNESGSQRKKASLQEASSRRPIRMRVTSSCARPCINCDSPRPEE